VLSGVVEPDAETEELCGRHPRLRYELANAEALPYASASFDLVLGEEVLHHLARPAQGLYEMLRVCRRRAVFVEPWECAAIACLERAGLTTRFESQQAGNLGTRDNHVFRWNERALDALLASYYLDSGARCEVRSGWLSNRVLIPRPGPLRAALLAAGWAASWLPGASGNLATVAIEPGRDLPPDPTPAAAPAR
jgi:SAM-dependent methyltransferase